MNRQHTIVLLVVTALLLKISETGAQEISAANKSLPLSGESFRIDGHEAFVITPEQTTENCPWVWYAPTLTNLPGKEESWMFKQFLEAGIAIAGVDVGESYGSPTGTNIYDTFYQYLTKQRNLSTQPVLLARSRGGLMLYNWAVEHADHVGAIAGIYPVCNLESYPGLERAKTAYGRSIEEMRTTLPTINPIDRLKYLAEAKVPILHLHGDQDTVVPNEQNSAVVLSRYLEQGGDMQIKLMKGQGHNMWTGWFQDTTLTHFVIKHAKQPATQPSEKSKSEPDVQQWLTFKGGDGPGKNRHIVLIAAEQEYRSEQSMPMLAKILSQHHGFDCTVLFSVNDEGKVDPTLPAPFKEKGKVHRIPGLDQLASADCCVWLSRFMQLPDDQMDHFHQYFDSGKPLLALRTANHGFWGGKPYQVNGQKVSLRKLLGGTFMGHHGGWHREATRGLIVSGKETHPILTGVGDIWGTSDVYRCHNDQNPLPQDCEALILGQPLQSLDQDAEPNRDKEPLPIGWTKTWTGNGNLESKLFHFTMGSAKDFANEGVRRIVVNAIYWGLNLDDKIDPSRSVNPVTAYQPMTSGFNYEKLGVIPKDVKDYLNP
ncbi:ThuA domain-containing protein [bacterium]|nr:ThuA domain-containing protein [bacterium]